MNAARIASLLMVLLALAAGCGSDKPADGSPNQPGPGDGDGDGDGDGPPGPGDDGSINHKPGVTPDEGATEFISADARGGESQSRGEGDLAGGLDSAPSDPTADEDGGSERVVERGDIFRVLGDGRILNLNAYRGLQILDVRNVNAPRVEGRLDLTGTPVELYVVGDRAVVLLNNWRGYYGTRDDVSVEVEEGGLVAVVDIGNRAQPELLDEHFVDGNIQTSRLTQGDGAALYVAAQEYGDWTDGSQSGVHTILRSFDVSGAELVAQSSLDLGGYVQDIQATTDVMMVASNSYDSLSGVQHSTVTLVDISNPDGTMVLGADVQPMGIVQNKFNMDVTGDVLRIVSGSSWSGTQTNHLETFDVSSLDTATPLDHCSFGDGQQLFATLFVEEKAFFVTYLRQDPFHAFSVDAQGQCEEHAEFIVSGWNDFFRATLDDSRLIGIGTNDEANTRKLAVSLYDISNIDNPSPLIDRDEIDLSGWSSSEAQWDDRAFSVLEGAVSVAAPNGAEETGLILLPFQGWDTDWNEYTAAVQVLTYSATTLTRRGVMDHGSSVRRSFLPSDGVAANLSEEQLSLFDLENPDAPAELGRVDVAPSFTQVIALSDEFVARVRDRGYYYYNPSGHLPKGRVEIVPRSGDIDVDAAVASFEVPSGAQIVQVGELLVSISSVYSATQPEKAEQPVYDTTIEVFDLSNPAAPRARGTLTTDKIYPSYAGGYYYGLTDIGFAADCFDCGGRYYGGGGPSQLVAGKAIVFPETHHKYETTGQAEYCYSYPNNGGCERATNEGCEGSYITGSIQCTRPLDETEAWCTGDIYECDGDGTSCELAPDAAVTENCSIQEQYRSWTHYSFEVLSLENPDAPLLAATVETPDADEGTLAIIDGTTVYFSYQQPLDVEDDPRPYVKRFVRKLDVSNPSAPSFGAGINVPGDVIAVDGSSIFTRDIVWDDFDAETLIARLELDGGLARLRAQRLFDQRMVQNVSVDGAGHVLVSHDPVWSYVNNGNQEPHTLSILNEGDLAVAGATEIDNWASFATAKDGKALFNVSGGVLVVNVEDPAAPVAQAYFASEGYWQGKLLLDRGEILMAAGPYGIHRFDSDTYNLRAR
jgi:hypothetical protein